MSVADKVGAPTGKTGVFVSAADAQQTKEAQTAPFQAAKDVADARHGSGAQLTYSGELKRKRPPSPRNVGMVDAWPTNLEAAR
jgi:hypothetical protein